MKSWAIIVLSIAFIWRAPAAELWSDAPHRSGTAVPLTSDTYVNVSRRVQPAVVYISTTQEILGHKAQPRFQGKPGEDDERFEDFFEYFGPRFFEHFFSMPPGRQQAPLQGLGSGFLIHKDGYLVTNNHVVEKASEITVTLQDGADFPAKVSDTGALELQQLTFAAGNQDLQVFRIHWRPNSPEKLVTLDSTFLSLRNINNLQAIGGSCHPEQGAGGDHQPLHPGP